MDDEKLVEIAYNKYCEAVGGVAFNGDPLPDWKTFSADPNKQKQVNAWRICINEVLDNYEAYR